MDRLASRLKQLPLRYQIALATFVPLVVFALLAAGVSAYALRHIPEELVLERQTALAQVAAAGVAGNLRTHVRALEATAAELAALAGDAERQRQLLRDRQALFHAFAGVSLLDAQGTVVAASPGVANSVGLNLADCAYFREARDTGAAAFSGVSPLGSAGEAGIVIAVPLRQGGAFAGVLLSQSLLSSPEWARDLNLLRSPEGAKAYLIDSASTVIYHPNSERVGTSIQTNPDLWRLVIAGRPQSALYRDPASDRLLVATYAPIPGVPWGLLVEEPWQAILASLIPYQWAVAGLMAFGVLLALLALVLSVRQVTRPLDALVAAGQRVAAGKPYETITPQGPPDLRTLIQVVNQMVAHLAQQQATLQHYARRMLEGQEDERLRISRDLHDETVQDLVALTQRIELCAEALHEDPALVRRRLREARALAYSTLAGVRRISHNLRPSTLEDLGLVAALQVLTRELAEQLPQAEVRCEIVGQEIRLPRELELTAFRIAQEALANVRKHARSARRVSVALVFEPWGLLLMVEDDGGGFAMADREALVREGHLGLIGMGERARLFGGQLNVATAPGEGTTVTLRLPLPNADAPNARAGAKGV